jgi:hypothetical protein
MGMINHPKLIYYIVVLSQPFVETFIDIVIGTRVTWFKTKHQA